MNKYYVYAICDPRESLKTEFGDYRPVYIGKGSNERYLVHIKEAKGICKLRGKNTLKYDRIKSIVDSGHEPVVVFVKKQLSNDDAYSLEISLIKLFGRIGLDENGILTNRAIDQKSRGGGKKGMKQTKPRDLTKWKESHTGWVPTPETRKLWKQQRTGRKASEETKARMRQSRLGSLNKSALWWEIITPKQIIVKVKSLKNWCESNNYSYHRVWSQKDGFLVRKIEELND